MPMFSLDPIAPQVLTRYVLGKQGLWPGIRWTRREGAAAALRAAESVQIDPVSVVAPSQDIVLWGRARSLFGFEYIWEISKPAAKRRYGPYTMPVLYGDRLVARVDAKLDRRTKTLTVNGSWVEEWFLPDESFASALARGLLDLALFLGAERVDTAGLATSLLRREAQETLRSGNVGPI